MSYRIEQLRYQLREDPSSRAFVRLAALLAEAGERDEAAAVLRRGLVHHPRLVTAWVALGRVLRDHDDREGAEHAFGRALALDATLAEAAAFLAEGALARGDWRAAEELVDAFSDGDDAAVESVLAEVAARRSADEARAAEEQARREAEAEAAAAERRRRAELRARPPVDVAGELVGDPFAELTAVGIEVGTAVHDVFEVDAPPPAETVVESIAEAEPAEAEPESWADVAEEVAATGEGEPLEEPSTGEPLEEPAAAAEGPAVDAGESSGAEAELVAVEAVVEPLPSPDGEPEEEPEPESWADLAEEMAAAPEREPLEAPVAEEPAAAEPTAPDEDALVEAEVAAVEAAVEPGQPGAAVGEGEVEPRTEVAVETAFMPDESAVEATAADGAELMDDDVAQVPFGDVDTSDVFETDGSAWPEMAAEPAAEPEPAAAAEVAELGVDLESPSPPQTDAFAEDRGPEPWTDLAVEAAGDGGVEPLPGPSAGDDRDEPFDGPFADEEISDIFEPEPEVEAAAEPADSTKALPESSFAEPEPAEEAERWDDLAASSGAEPEPLFADELALPEGVLELEALVGDALPPAGTPRVRPDDGPLPTLTLARLAAHQGAFDLAVTTLERLLEREPGNLEAVEFLERLRAGEPAPGVRRGRAAKVAALRAWLDTIRLASERLGT